ncbi:hypothetical protein [Rhizobium leguminosarum]|uniref:hypothetical protein n=1 Tax=Rhizobium leguminosarum TaxID=384 RepID=UPI00387E6A2E
MKVDVWEGLSHGLPRTRLGAARETAWASTKVDILAPRSLIAVANHFRGMQVLSMPETAIRDNAVNLPDLAENRGQEGAKRALEVATAGAIVCSRMNKRPRWTASKVAAFFNFLDQYLCSAAN